MVKKTIVLVLLSVVLYSEDAYERNCVKCHEGLPTTLQRMFMNYIETYSSEKNVKIALKHYMRYPNKNISVMSDLFLKSFALKEPLTISEEELEEAIDIYWEKYKVIGKLK